MFKKDMYDYRDYEECAKENFDFFQQYKYHSIVDLNLIKMAKVLENGIICRKNLKEYCLYTEPLNSYACKNGSEYISLSICDGNFPLNPLFDAFAMHALASPTIMIKNDIETQKVGLREGFDDEIFALGDVSKNNFEGILLPEHLCTKLMSDIAPFFNNCKCLKKEYVEAWITLVENYFQRKIDREKIINMACELDKMSLKYFHAHCTPDTAATRSLEEQKQCYGQDLNEMMALVAQQLWNEKLNQDDVTYIDVIKYINKEELPIHIITKKKIKRIL